MDLDGIRAEALAAIEAAGDDGALQALRLKYLGKKSALSESLREIGMLDVKARAEAGAKSNRVKKAIEEALDARGAALLSAREGALGTREWLDLSLPAEAPRNGHLHPITLVEEALEHLFRRRRGAPYPGPRRLQTDTRIVPASHRCSGAGSGPADRRSGAEKSEFVQGQADGELVDRVQSPMNDALEVVPAGFSPDQ